MPDDFSWVPRETGRRRPLHKRPVLVVVIVLVILWLIGNTLGRLQDEPTEGSWQSPPIAILEDP